MAHNYTGNAGGIGPHEQVAITAHDDADAFSAAVANTPLEQLADIVAYLQANAALRGSIESAVFNGPNGDTNAAIESGGTVSTRKLRFDFGSAGAVNVRFYSRADGAGELTVNAAWNGTQWERDADDGARASKLFLGGDRVRLYTYPPASPGVFDDAAWVLGMSLPKDGRVTFSETTTASTGSNPPAATALANTIVAKNVCKAFGSISSAPDSTLTTLLDGFNVSGVALVDSNRKLRVTFASPMADANYAVSVTSSPGPSSDTTYNFVPRVSAKATTHVDLMFSGTFGADLEVNGWGLDVLVFGRQDS